jgi:hypothetical protein
VKKFRELTEQASRDVRNLKNPDVYYFVEMLNPILSAMDTGQVEFGYFVNNIHIGDDFVTIDCSFYVMGCRKEDIIKFPTFLLDSEDPYETSPT